MPKSKRFIKTANSCTFALGNMRPKADFNFAGLIYFNRAFDKSRLKGLVRWTLDEFGEKKTLDVVETLKGVGYSSATEAGLSLSIDDLLVPPSKISHIIQTETKLEHTQRRVSKGYLTSVEYLSQVITTWNVTNDVIKNQVIAHFRSRDILNPVYMMAFSGARGNISQVRQLVGMRGLMSDPSGNIIDYAIQSNFREGLTLTEYVISCYGARKGVVDTALRTATSGYLTRRLVDVAQHVVIRQYDCSTTKGIYLTALENEDKVFMTGPFRLVGRVLAEDVYDINPNQPKRLAQRNQEVTPELSNQLFKYHKKILVRSPLTCEDKNFVCQLCYGWNLSRGRLVSIGETVGIIAAQSIGEPGTQLTMRTFHTGGVFSGEIAKTLQAPVHGKISFLKSIPGKCVRTDQGEVAFLTKQSGTLYITHLNNPEKKRVTKYFLQPYTIVFVKQGEIVYPNQTLAELTSLDSLSNKQLSYQTILSPLAGEVKFKKASVAKGAHYPNYTTFVPLNQHASEFWILSAQTKKFMNPIKAFVKPGDRVGLKSPVLTYLLFSQPKQDQFDSFPFQQYICSYRIQTLLTFFQKKMTNQSTTTLAFNPSHDANVHFQPSAWISPSLMERGTILERLLPFVAFSPKQRFWFGLKQMVKKYRNRLKPTIPRSQLVRQTAFQQKNQNQDLLRQRKQNRFKKTNTKHFFKFQRFLTVDLKLCKRPDGNVYQLAFNKKMLPFLSSSCFTGAHKQILFSSTFKFERKTDVEHTTFFYAWLTHFEKKFFLSITVLPAKEDKLRFMDYKKRFCLKRLFNSSSTPKRNLLIPFYHCPVEKLWRIAYLNQPTDGFKQSFDDMLPQGLTWNLNCELERVAVFDSQIFFPDFCFCFRLVNHYRFQPVAEILLYKSFDFEPKFKPFTFKQLVEDSKGEWESKPIDLLYFLVKSAPRFDRVNKALYEKACFLLVKQKQAQFNTRLSEVTKTNTPLVSTTPYFGGFQYPTQLFNDPEKISFLKRKDRQYLTSETVYDSNKIWNFHELIQLPFCFDPFFAREFKQLRQKTFQKAMRLNPLKKSWTQNFFSYSNMLKPFQIQTMENTLTTKPKNTVLNGILQKTLLFQLLKNKTEVKFGNSNKFLSLILFFISSFSKLLLWKQIGQKFTQLKKFSNLKSNLAVKKTFQNNPVESICCFLKKVCYKNMLVRSIQQLYVWQKTFFSQVSKRIWFPIKKRRHLTLTRLNLVYRLTQVLSGVHFRGFGLFIRPVFCKPQPNRLSLVFPFMCFYFVCLKTQYHCGWNTFSRNENRTQYGHNTYSMGWFFQLLYLLSLQRKQKQKRRKTKSKVASRVKAVRLRIRSQMRSWFYPSQKPQRWNFSVPSSFFPSKASDKGPFVSCEPTQIFWKTSISQIQQFLQKNYQNRFVAEFKKDWSKAMDLTMQFLLTKNSNALQLVCFKGTDSSSTFTETKTDKKLFQKKPLNHSQFKSPQKIVYFLKQIKKASLQKTKRYQKVTKKKQVKTLKKKLNNFSNNKTLQLSKPFKRNFSQVFDSFFSVSVFKSMLKQKGFSNQTQYLNPLSWLSLVSFSNKHNRHLHSYFQCKELKTEFKRHTAFSFSHTKFNSSYDPWWRHQMHSNYISASFVEGQKDTQVKTTALLMLIRQFKKHPNPFFASYLEKNFFNQTFSYNKDKEKMAFQMFFIKELLFYVQAIKLSVKKRKKSMNHMDFFAFNLKTLNNYVRFVFLKTAKLPFILAAKNTVGTQLQKRFLLIKQNRIYVSTTTRYRPSLIFNTVKSKKATSIELMAKSSYILSMQQKGVVYRSGESLVQPFGQSDFSALDRGSFSNLMFLASPKEAYQKMCIPAFKLLSPFSSSTVNKFQSVLLQSNLNPSSRWMMLYQNHQFQATHTYVSNQFSPSGYTFNYSCPFLQKRKHSKERNLFVQPHSVKKLGQFQTFSEVPMSVKNPTFKKQELTTITETSHVSGFVLQCFDQQTKVKNPPIYEHNMRRFRDQPRTEYYISYLTDQDVVTYKLDSPLQKYKLGSFIAYGEPVNGCLLNEPGQIIYLTKNAFVLRKAQCFFLAAGSECNLHQGDLVSFGSPLVKVAYSQIQTEDIIQGIPKINQLFEARTRFGFQNLKELLAHQYQFLKKEGRLTKRAIVLECIDFIQKQIVDGVQTVYQSQGVTISDKHIEIIVKQMTAKVRVNTAIRTGFLRGDVIPFHLVESLNLDAEDLLFECEPILLGITQAALRAEGFLSAASFQETVRVLSQAVVVRKIDYLKNLKENIIIGHLLPTGTSFVEHAFETHTGQKNPLINQLFSIKYLLKERANDQTDFLNTIRNG